MEKNNAYPTLPNAEGFYFESDSDEALEISTKEYENGNLVKKVQLRKGKFAIVRELDRKEMNKVREIANGDNEKMAASLIATCAKIDDKELIMEDVLEFKAKDYNRLTVAAQSLNF